MLLSQFLGQLGTKPNSKTLSRLFNLDPATNKFIVGIYNDTRDFNSLKQQVNQVEFYDGGWPAFDQVVLSFVRLCSQLDPNLLVMLFDLYAQFLSDVSVAFTNLGNGALIASVIAPTVDTVVPMARKLDQQLKNYEADAVYPRLTFLASVLLRVFNHIRSQLGDNTPEAKQLLLLYVSNKLCFIYNQIGNPLLCQNVFSNITTANLKFSQFPAADQLQYRFYLAKFYLIKQHLVDAYRHFSWCVERCLARERERVLKYLVPLGMTLGRSPNFNGITRQAGAVSWLPVYRDIAGAVSAGNYAGFVEAVTRHEAYLKQMGLLVLVRSKLEVVLFRNLLRQVWKIQGQALTLTYGAIQNALRLLWDAYAPEGGVDALVVENMVVSLVDQNLLRGKLVLSVSKVAVASSNVFPEISGIYTQKFGGASDKWMDD